MLQSLNSVLAANAAVLQHAVMPGPAGSGCAAGVVLADIAKVPCDAYVVPHYPEEKFRHTLSSALFRAGAADGVLAYEDYAKSRGSEGPSWGDVYVADCGRGNAECLIHVVGMRSGGRERELSSVEYQVFAGMKSAMESGFKSIVFPALCMGEFGTLSAELSSNLIFNSIYSHWRDNDTHAPRSVLVAVPKVWSDYLVFVRALGEIVPSDADMLESETFILTRESVRNLIAKLSPQALYTFYFIVKRGEENLREICEIQPWFERVKVLFTEKDRKQLHPIAVEALSERYKEAVGES